MTAPETPDSANPPHASAGLASAGLASADPANEDPDGENLANENQASADLFCPVLVKPESASLIIVSRHRTPALLRALRGVAQMDHPCFEVIVVADPAACDAVRRAGWQVKLAAFDQPNIALARNLGLGLAAAPVVAFLDDDAVPEPTWLSRLVAPFADRAVVQAGGFVRGRSGLAWQWRAMQVDAHGFDTEMKVPATPSLHPGSAQLCVKTQGTNCAFRRDTLLAIGGFDPAFAFYLDEADVNLRLASLGLTAVVPGAVVHHGFAASARRRADRVPTDLTQIGASIAAFVARHAGGDRHALARHTDAQRARLLRHLQTGGLEPRDLRRLLAGLADGMAQRPPAAPDATLPASPLPLMPLSGTGPREGVFLCGPARDRAALHAAAARSVAEGRIVTVLCLSRGLRPHQHRFVEGGWWEQSGGRFGRAERGAGRFVWQSAATRQHLEHARLAAFRPVGSGENLPDWMSLGNNL